MLLPSKLWRALLVTLNNVNRYGYIKTTLSLFLFDTSNVYFLFYSIWYPWEHHLAIAASALVRISKLGHSRRYLDLELIACPSSTLHFRWFLNLEDSTLIRHCTVNHADAHQLWTTIQYFDFVWVIAIGRKKGWRKLSGSEDKHLPCTPGLSTSRVESLHEVDTRT